jgi:hypothetical protein
VSVGLFVNRSALARQLNDLQLVPQPERYTELYFENHQQLPVLVKPGDKQDLPFTVHNREHNTITYSYKVMAGITEETDGYVLGEGTITLAHDSSQTLHPTISVPPLGQRIAIKVALQYQGIAFGDKRPGLQTQSIHHWVSMPSLRSSGDGA